MARDQRRPITYRNRSYGSGGGYGQTGPGLNYDGDAPEVGVPYRVPPSPEFSGYHLDAYAAEHYGRPNERERRRMRWMEPYAEETPERYGGEARDNRGRGPRGYVRRDARIADDVNDRLTDDDWLDATDIEVSVSAGEVTLSGSVDSRDAKRRAADIAESVSGVLDVFNQLRIQSDRVGPLPRPTALGQAQRSAGPQEEG